MRRKHLVAGAAPLLLLAACSTDLLLRIDDADLDAHEVRDPARLVSVEVPAPTVSQRESPVVIAVHGYGASPYETEPVAEQLRAHGGLVSQVLLGGHGTTVRDLARCTFEDWGAPILEERSRLVALGFTDLTLLGTSTGATLILDLVARHRIEPVPRRFVFVSPLIQFVDRRADFLGLFALLGVQGARLELGGTSRGHWYSTRPIATLRELRRLVTRCQAELRQGLELPAGARVLAIQSTGDKEVAAAGVELLQSRIRGAAVEVKLVDSTIHVPIKPIGSDREWTAKEIAQQRDLLDEIQAFLSQ